MTKPRTPKAKAVKPVRAWALLIDGKLQSHQLNDASPVAVYRRRKDALVWFDGEYVVRVLITVVGK